MTLTEFLLARIAEDEAVAGTSRLLRHGGRPEAQRLLADCEAKRKIVERFERGEDWWDVLVILASAHPDHPDYRDEWRA